jgi:hypothetical protein
MWCHVVLYLYLIPACPAIGLQVCGMCTYIPTFQKNLLLPLSFFYYEDGGSRFLWNVGTYLPNYALPHPYQISIFISNRTSSQTSPSFYPVSIQNILYSNKPVSQTTEPHYRCYKLKQGTELTFIQNLPQFFVRHTLCIAVSSYFFPFFWKYISLFHQWDVSCKNITRHSYCRLTLVTPFSNILTAIKIQL